MLKFGLVYWDNTEISTFTCRLISPSILWLGCCEGWLQVLMQIEKYDYRISAVCSTDSRLQDFSSFGFYGPEFICFKHSYLDMAHYREDSFINFCLQLVFTLNVYDWRSSTGFTIRKASYSSTLLTATGFETINFQRSRKMQHCHCELVPSHWLEGQTYKVM